MWVSILSFIQLPASRARTLRCLAFGPTILFFLSQLQHVNTPNLDPLMNSSFKAFKLNCLLLRETFHDSFPTKNSSLSLYWCIQFYSHYLVSYIANSIEQIFVKCLNYSWKYASCWNYKCEKPQCLLQKGLKLVWDVHSEWTRENESHRLRDGRNHNVSVKAVPGLEGTEHRFKEGRRRERGGRWRENTQQQ